MTNLQSAVTLARTTSNGGVMGNPRLNELFARYRASGDPKDLGRVFDECAPGLLRIARRLSRDAAGAEDLLQETFLVAIEHSGAWDASRPVGPWLIGILTNRARTARRRAGRAVAADRLEIREPGSPEEDLQGAELESAVREALQDLPEGERAAVGARLFEGLTGPEIAERFGISSGLGRVRLHRGLQRLRASLPSGLSLGTGGLLFPSATLARIKAAVLADAARASGGSAAVQASAVGSFGVLKIAGAAAGLAIVLLGALAILKQSDPLGPLLDSQTAALETELVPQLAEEEGERVAAAGGRAPIAADGVAEEPDRPETVSVTARIVNGITGEPMAGAVVLATDARGSRRQWKELSSGDDGRVHFVARAAAPTVTFRVDPTDTTGEASRVVKVSGLTGDVIVEILGGGVFEGRVVDGEGSPVPGAELRGWCGTHSRDKDAPHRTAKADSLGRFRIEHLGPSFHLMADADGFASTVGFRGELNAGEAVSGLDLVLHRAGFVEGRVVDLDGRGIEGVKITSEPGFGSSSWDDQTDFPSVHKLYGRWVEAETDGRGEFRAGPVPMNGGGGQLALEARGFLRLVESYRPQDNPHRITLDPGLSLIGEVRLPDGSPASGASVIVGPYVKDPAAVRGRWATDATGGFRANGFAIPTGSSFEAPPYVFVSLPGYAIALAQPVEPSRRPAEHVARIQLEPELTIGGRVVWPDGTAAADVQLKVEGERVYEAEATWSHPPTWEWKAGVDKAVSAADGRFVFRQLGKGKYKVHAIDPADPKRRITVEAIAGADPIEIVLDPEALDGNVIEGLVVNAVTHQAIPEFKIVASEGDIGLIYRFSDAAGRFRVTGLGAGPIGLSVEAEGFANLSLPAKEYPTGDDPVELGMWPRATLRFRVVDESGNPFEEQCVLTARDLAGGRLMLEQGSGTKSSQYRTMGSDPHRGRIFGLPATQITVHLACGEESAQFPVDLAAMGDEEIEFVLPRTPKRPLGTASFLLAYLPGLDPIEAAETFVEFHRAKAAGENPLPETGLSMEQIDPVRASVELTMTHESGKRRFRFTAKALPDGQLEVEDSSEDLRELASGARYWSESLPRKTPFAEFSVYDWAGTWDVTATSKAFKPYSGKVTIDAQPPGEEASERFRIPEPKFIKVERR